MEFKPVRWNAVWYYKIEPSFKDLKVATDTTNKVKCCMVLKIRTKFQRSKSSNRNLHPIEFDVYFRRISEEFQI